MELVSLFLFFLYCVTFCFVLTRHIGIALAIPLRYLYTIFALPLRYLSATFTLSWQCLQFFNISFNEYKPESK